MTPRALGQYEDHSGGLRLYSEDYEAGETLGARRDPGKVWESNIRLWDDACGSIVDEALTVRQKQGGGYEITEAYSEIDLSPVRRCG